MEKEELEMLVKNNLSKDGKSLDLTAEYIKELGVKDLAKMEILKDLTSLEMGRNLIGVKGAKYLASSKVLTNLTSLNLYYNQLDNDGAKYIAVSENLVSLANFNLSGNGIGDEGAKMLAKFLPLYTNLIRLDLRFNRIKEEGQEALREAQKLTKIKQLLLDVEEGFQVKTQ
ncbi:MAG: hypothetical protein ACE5EK_05995 [Nitrospinales bacterium]